MLFTKCLRLVFFIALGLPERAERYGKKPKPSPIEPNNMAKEDMPLAEERGFFPMMFDRFFGDQGDKAALKEKEEDNMWVLKRK